MADANSAEAKLMYDAAKRELIGALTKKRAVDKALASLEAQLYAFEGSYLSETSNSGGNIITGFDSYLKGANTGGRRRHEVTDGDRMFSSSSTTYFRSLELQNGPASPPLPDLPMPSQGLTTVALPAERESSAGAVSSSRRDRDRKRKRTSKAVDEDEEDEEDEEETSSRLRISRGPRGYNKRLKVEE